MAYTISRSAHKHLFSMTKALFLLSYYLSTVAAICWTPNHRDVNAGIKEGEPDNYVPCNPDAVASMCCATWDVCVTPLGLCYNEENQLWWRESCTDSSWQSDNCVKLFLTESDGDISLTQCANGSWCAFANATGVECCNEGRGVYLDSTATASSPFPTSTSPPTSTTATPAAITTTAPTASAEPQEEDEEAETESGHGLSSSARTGLGLGIGLGGFGAIALMSVLFICRRHRRHMKKLREPIPPRKAADIDEVTEMGMLRPPPPHHGALELPGSGSGPSSILVSGHKGGPGSRFEMGS